MVHGVNGTNGVNNIDKITLKHVEANNTAIGSTFGDGFAASTGVGVTRTIPGLDDLLQKYNFDTPAYEKNVAQLEIDDKYYIQDQPFVEENFCEV